MHRWEVFKKNELAFYSKRDDGQTSDLFWAIGTIQKCLDCPKMRIIPNRKELATVEVELVDPVRYQKVLS